MSDYFELAQEHKAISIEAGHIIDTSWHHSWHWEREKHGSNLTDVGMAKMKEDLNRRISETRDTLSNLEMFRQRVIRLEQGIVPGSINDVVDPMKPINIKKP